MQQLQKNSSERACSKIEYFFRRIYSSFFYYKIYRRLFKDHPFYTPSAIKYISKIIKPDFKVLEWGSGASTIWLSNKVKELVTIEHDESWFKKVSSKLNYQNIKNVQLRYIPEADFSEFNFEKDWEYYNVLKHPPRKESFFNYIKIINEYNDHYFDCIIIDGRERVGCLAHAIKKLTPNGYIILDDSHRPKYNEFFTVLNDWNYQQFNFGLLQTTIFYRK